MAKKKKSKRTNVDREVPLWDRIWLYVKSNEKIFWVVLLVLISFSFAFTGPITEQLGSLGQGGYPRYSIGGETVFHQEVTDANWLVDKVQQMRGLTIAIYREAGLFAESIDVLTRWGENAVLSNQDGTTNEIDYFLLLREADRLGIHVSDEELADEIRQYYWALKARDEASETETAKTTNRLDTPVLKASFTRLRDGKLFDFAEWSRILRRRSGRIYIPNPRLFEESVRDYLRIEKLVGYVKSSVHVTADEARQRFFEEEQQRKVSFFEVEPDESASAEIESSITEDELRAYYDENAQRYSVYQNSAKLRIAHVYIPTAHFEGEVDVSDAKVEEHYQEIRDEKFRRDLDVEPTAFELRTPEEEKEREAKLYTPLADVRETVVESLVEKQSNTLAREFADNLKKRLFPADEAASPPTLEELAEEHSFIEAGQTPFIGQWDAKDRLGKADSFEVSGLFRSASENARKSAADRTPIKPPRFPAISTDKSGFVVYPSVESIYSGDESFDLFVDEIREKVIEQKLLDRAEESTKELVEAIRKGEKTFEKVAESVDARVHTSSYVKKTGAIQLPVEEEEGEAKETDEEEEADPSKPKTERFRGSYVVLQEAFTIESDGQIGEPVRDDAQGTYYVVRLDGRLSPAPEDFDDAARKRFENQLLRDRRSYYFQKWRKKLWEESEVQSYGTSNQ